MPTTSFGNWDFSNYHVQQELRAGQFVSAESTLVAAGKPTLGDNAEGGGNFSGEQSVYPIGLLEQASIQQSKQLQRVFEIGSSRSYFIPGRVIGSLNLGRTFFFGPSLLRVLYAYYKNSNPNSAGGKIGDKGEDATTTLEDGVTEIADPQARLLNSGSADSRKLHRSPGADYFFIDLASDMFAQPTGMAVYFKDFRHNSVGAMYLENLYIQGHQMTINSGSVLIMEGTSAQYDRMQPIDIITSE